VLHRAHQSGLALDPDIFMQFWQRHSTIALGDYALPTMPNLSADWIRRNNTFPLLLFLQNSDETSISRQKHKNMVDWKAVRIFLFFHTRNDFSCIALDRSENGAAGVVMAGEAQQEEVWGGMRSVETRHKKSSTCVILKHSEPTRKITRPRLLA
jgi:hypothetical protein